MTRRLMLMLAVLAMPVTLHAEPTGGATVTVEIKGLRSTAGTLRACLTAKVDTFPECEKDPAALRLTVPAHDGPVLVFRHVAPGAYGVSLFHDANNNGRLDKTLGIPNEGFGFSRDAPVHMAPPKFDAARIVVGTADMTTAITVRYIL